MEDSYLYKNAAKSLEKKFHQLPSDSCCIYVCFKMYHLTLTKLTTWKGKYRSRITQNKGKESENSYQKLKRSQ